MKSLFYYNFFQIFLYLTSGVVVFSKLKWSHDKAVWKRGEQAPTPVVICFRTNQKPYRVLFEIKQLNEIITLHTKNTRDTQKDSACTTNTMPLKKENNARNLEMS